MGCCLSHPRIQNTVGRASKINPIPAICGHSTGYFYKTQLRPTLKRIDLYVTRWARRKFKRLRRKTKGHETGLIGYAE